MYDEECTGGYECEADGHAPGCLSHAIDPLSELEVAATDLPDKVVNRLVRRGARRYRDDQ
jgi:hypothetical protein